MCDDPAPLGSLDLAVNACLQSVTVLFLVASTPVGGVRQWSLPLSTTDGGGARLARRPGTRGGDALAMAQTVTVNEATSIMICAGAQA
ncbi:MAG TPA: hypothetical protein DGP25_09280 [Brevundimonas sp.]|nr:hypothetical protein HMPREF0185_03135 [Brevundimonas diminuta 470-4]HAC00115.1 hypothetical protein [Brevundimonas sp.]HCW50147.1 hypothetical protein [Brevundimonas sp.]